MRLLDPQGVHESGNVVREKLGGPGTCGFVRFACPAEVERDAGKVLGVFRHLKGVTGMVGAQIRNKQERLSASLLLIVDGEVVGFDLRHGNFSFFAWCCLLAEPTLGRNWKMN